jgi:hypothetical protein
VEARKDDTGKLRFDLIPIGPLRKLAEVYTIGAKKYSDRNWEKGLSWGRIYAALQRHSTAWWAGEIHDPIDGQHHLASVAWCALALIEYEQTHPELDDRLHATWAKEDKLFGPIPKFELDEIHKHRRWMLEHEGGL